MFERYNESARRMLFFSRYESSQLGSQSIETEHLLLGLIREMKGVTGRVLELAKVTPEQIRKAVEGQVPLKPKVSTSVEIPFSEEMTRVLASAAAEADRFLHAYIGTEHLLLGLLSEEHSVAGRVLNGYGIRLEETRKAVSELVGEGGREAWVSSTVNPAELVNDLARLTKSLAEATPGSEQTSTLMNQIHMALGQLRGCFGQ